jgi:hypothetical protein
MEWNARKAKYNTPMKFTLHTKAQNRGPFNCRPAAEYTLEDDRINVSGADCYLGFPGNSNVGKLYVIGNEFGAVCAVTARHEQDALDQMIDTGLGDSFLVDPQPTHEEAEENEYTGLGNAGEYCDLTYAWIAEVDMEPVRDIELIVACAKAEGAAASLLSEV